MVLSRQGRFAEAETIDRRVLELSPEDPNAHRDLGIDLERQGRLDEAEAAYRRAVELAPDDPDFQITLGNLLGS